MSRGLVFISAPGPWPARRAHEVQGGAAWVAVRKDAAVLGGGDGLRLITRVTYAAGRPARPTPHPSIEWQGNPMAEDFAREERNQVEVVIFTEQYRLVGTMHVVPGSRVTEYLVSRVEGNFIPMTEVKAYSIHSGQLFFEAGFLNVSVNAIILTYPLSEQQTVTLPALV